MQQEEILNFLSPSVKIAFPFLNSSYLQPHLCLSQSPK